MIFKIPPVVSPIIEKNSIDFDIAFYGNRYDEEKKNHSHYQRTESMGAESVARFFMLVSGCISDCK